MSEIKLTASNPTQQRILDYLKVNASDVLAEKINAGSKTISGALAHCKSEAQNLKHDDGCVCVEDATVFGWIMHYFEEDSITEKAKPDPVRLPGGVAKKAEPKKTEPPKPAVTAGGVKLDPQQNLFDQIMSGGKKR